MSFIAMPVEIPSGSPGKRGVGRGPIFFEISSSNHWFLRSYVFFLWGSKTKVFFGNEIVGIPKVQQVWKRNSFRNWPTGQRNPVLEKVADLAKLPFYGDVADRSMWELQWLCNVAQAMQIRLCVCQCFSSEFQLNPLTAKGERGAPIQKANIDLLRILPLHPKEDEFFTSYQIKKVYALEDRILWDGYILVWYWNMIFGNAKKIPVSQADH